MKIFSFFDRREEERERKAQENSFIIVFFFLLLLLDGIYLKHLHLTTFLLPSRRTTMLVDNETNFHVEEIQWLPGLQISACIFYSLVLLVGLTGNILVIVIVMKYRDMRNATNLLLMNLSVADLFLLVFCIADGYQHLYGKDKHRLGRFLCKSNVLCHFQIIYFRYFQVSLVHTSRIAQPFVPY